MPGHRFSTIGCFLTDEKQSWSIARVETGDRGGRWACV